ncbi:hypothetical protein J7M28_10230 [bacterium]|nr:hypothetical protein [bacterium]
MNVIELIESKRWHILSTFVQFGISPRRLESEFTPEEIYHIYRLRCEDSWEHRQLRPRSDLSAISAESRNGLVGRGGEFPNDVKYLSPREASDMVALSQSILAAKAKRGQALSERERIWLWDDKRRRACLGTDVVARRCSMDDYLWAIYREYRSRGVHLTISACRHIHQTKRSIAPLYAKEVVGVEINRNGLSLFCAPPSPSAGVSLQNDSSRPAWSFDELFSRLRAGIEARKADLRG